MSNEKIIGHEAIDNGEYIVVLQRSERLLGALISFLIGTLISLVFYQELSGVQLISLVLTTTLIGYISSKGESTREVLKQRVVMITRRRNYVAVYYSKSPDTSLLDVT